MTSRDSSASKEPSRRNHDLNGSKSNSSAPKILPSREGRGQRSHDPTLSPGTPVSSTELNPADQTGCFDKPSLARYLKLSVRTLDRLAARGVLPPADLVVGRSSRWSPSTIERWLRTRPRLPGRGGRP